MNYKTIISEYSRGSLGFHDDFLYLLEHLLKVLLEGGEHLACQLGLTSFLVVPGAHQHLESLHLQLGELSLRNIE